MSDTIDKIHDAIHEAYAEYPEADDWPVYVPSKMLDDVNDHTSEYTPMEVYKKGTTIAGHSVISDPLIDQPVVLPQDNNDVPYSMGPITDPPEQLLRQVLRIYGIEKREMPSGHYYITRMPIHVHRERVELNREKIAKYGLRNHPGEQDSSFDEYRRVKFVYREQYTTDKFATNHDSDWIEQKMAQAIVAQINSIQKHPVTGIRRRKIRYPWRILDFTHEEEHVCGTKYTHYGGVLLPAVDTSANKIELRPLD